MFLAAPNSEFSLHWNGPSNPRTIPQPHVQSVQAAIAKLDPSTKTSKSTVGSCVESNIDIPFLTNYEQEVNQFFLDLFDRTPCYEYDHVLFELNAKFLSKDLADFFNEYVKVSPIKSLQICMMTLFQNNASWQYERRLRIGGSNCYGLYTYTKNANPDWEKKIKNLLHSMFKGNAATRYGHDCEPKARLAYELKMMCHIILLGSVICTNACWLSFSPDGFCIINGKPILIEIKSPELGKTLTSSELVKKCPFLVQNGGDSFKLKEKHQYYGQVQLGMQLLQVNMCHLVVYASLDNSVTIIEVEKNEEFLSTFIPALSHVYYEQILPVLVLEKNQEMK